MGQATIGAGSVLGRTYVIERELGQGGMAVVYLATDRKHHRQVAVKVMRPEVSATLGSDRFLNEIQIAARLTHPHILPAFDSGSDHDVLYYVMPFVDGESLRERLVREQRLPIDEALRISREVADGLAYAHGLGIVHRDIKPENILLANQHAVIADFGVAHAVQAAGRPRITQGGTAVGTPEYMSPEQALGEEPNAGGDVYALACVLYEMLAGAPPFAGPNAMAVLAKKAIEPVPDLRAVRPEVPRGLGRVLANALANAPAERYASAEEFLAALEPANLEAPAPPALSIAVLPFKDLGGTDQSGYLGEGLADEIITALARIRALRVASRTSSFSFRDTRQDIRQIGTQLGVASVLEGSVQRAGDRLRITAQLIDVASGYHRWTARYDRAMADVFAIQDEIAHSIVRALQVVLSEHERRVVFKAPVCDIQAYEYYLQGRQYFHQAREQSLRFAQQMFSKAVEIDPRFALAWAGLAETCALYHLYYPRSDSNLTLADEASQKALQLDPQLAEAHAARGFVLFQMKRLDEAEPAFQMALQLDPQSFEGRYYLARARFQQGRFEDAAQLFEEAAQVREDYQARFFAAQSMEALGQDASTAYRRAFRVIEEHVELNPDDSRAMTMGACALCRLDENDKGLAWARQALDVDPGDPGVAYNVACVYAVAQRHDEAIDTLAQAVEQGFGNVDWVSHDPDWASLKGHPRFEALLRAQAGSETDRS
jgi:serine/threonine protein kinase/Flp pilus assembly protein TadD